MAGSTASIEIGPIQLNKFTMRETVFLFVGGTNITVLYFSLFPYFVMSLFLFRLGELHLCIFCTGTGHHPRPDSPLGTWAFPGTLETPAPHLDGITWKQWPWLFLSGLDQ